MLNLFIAAATILILSGIDMFIFKHGSWTMYESLVCTTIFAIFLKLKD